MKEKTKPTNGDGSSIALLVTMLKQRGWTERDLAGKLKIGWGRLSALEAGKYRGTPEIRSQLEGMLASSRG